MAELVGAVTKITSGFLEINSISIDNWGFKFFYKWTTTLLVCVPPLVEHTKKFNLQFEWIGYTRKNLSFPQYQIYPHQNFNQEVIDKFKSTVTKYVNWSDF